MSPFRRQTVQPSLVLTRQLALRQLASWIPTGFRWFSPTSLRADAELGRHLRAWADALGDVRQAAEMQRFNVFLGTASGAGLDQLGRALGFPRRPGESDDAYANRMAQELTAARVTPSALEAFVPALTGGTVNARIYEPWRDVWLFGDKTGMSGFGRFANHNYYHGGVFELQTDAVVENLDDYVSRMKAAGTLAWQALLMENNVPYTDDPLAARLEFGGERQGFVTNSVDVSVESVGMGTDFEVVVIELPMDIEWVANSTHRLSWSCGLTHENAPRNYALVADMLASAMSGTPVYRVSDTPMNPVEPTDVQASPIVKYEFRLDAGDALGDPTLIFVEE